MWLAINKCPVCTGLKEPKNKPTFKLFYFSVDKTNKRANKYKCLKFRCK